MRNTRSLFGFIAALGIPLALSACLTGETEIGHTDASVALCGQSSTAVDFASDTQNCGACGVVCPATNGQASCSRGVCGLLTCNKNYADCDTSDANGCEANLHTDVMHCGSCSVRCDANQLCIEGVCSTEASVCDSGRGDCDANTANGCETDLLTNAANCGACGMNCGSTMTCIAGACSTGTDVCYGTFANCDTLATNGCETDLSSSTNNCGACGKACATGTSCVSGTCTNATGPCTANRSNCDNDTSNGCEVDLSSDPANCGACGTVCASDKFCIQGQCAYSDIICNSGYANCNATLTDGCEVNTASDPLNCGTCANVCQTGTSCVAGVCQPPAGLTLCSTAAVNLLTDPMNCGSCGSMCASGSNATATCSAGTCSILCAQGYANCDNVSSNGCEANLSADASHCGSCGNFCGTGNICSQGTCGVQSTICTTGYADCNGDPADGCEVNIETSVTHCGACGKACNVPNATPMCSLGNCVTNACNAGYGDCDGNSSNGCEVNFSTDTNNCGACNSVCASGKTCVQGVCVTQSLVCAAGYANCDNSGTNGFEVNLSSDSNNCGSCGTACSRANSTSTCSGGYCSIQFCVGTFANCDGNSSNGCETDVSSSNTHCGACGTACAAGKQCTAGACI